MKKVIIGTIFVSVMTLLSVSIYYSFFSWVRYNNKPQFVPDFYFWGIVLFFIVVTFLFGKYVLKIKKSTSVVTAVLLATSIIYADSKIDDEYGHIFNDYYQYYPNESLLSFGKYTEIEGNFFTIIRTLNADGISVEKISGNNGDQQLGKQKIYLVDGEYYIVFDWEELVVTETANKKEISVILEEQVGEEILSIIKMQGNFLTARLGTGQIKNYSLRVKNNQIELNPI
ncbi:MULTISPECIES: hypothetical protein [Bacillaceae]|uniref:Uncharacterized protein n=1 Tax=Evansella alkalicola TaxID=745819 RepID=A0ABS6JUX0_9BACI|nr:MULTISPECIES: hypothetical protein [Bacillaceae]MBU9722364.1 hypothetical protein [Bacillus alkalicola]